MKIEIDTIVSTKVPVGDDYWYTTYGIPKPDNYDELKAEMQEAKKEIETIPSYKSKTPGPDNKVKDKKVLLDTKKKNLFDTILKNLADFFDQAQH